MLNLQKYTIFSSYNIRLKSVSISFHAACACACAHNNILMFDAYTFQSVNRNHHTFDLKLCNWQNLAWFQKNVTNQSKLPDIIISQTSGTVLLWNLHTVRIICFNHRINLIPESWQQMRAQVFSDKSLHRLIFELKCLSLSAIICRLG